MDRVEGRSHARPEDPPRRGVGRPGSLMFIRRGGVPIPAREPPCACVGLRLAGGGGEPATAAAERFEGNLRSRPTVWVSTRQNRTLLSSASGGTPPRKKTPPTARRQLPPRRYRGAPRAM